MRWTDTPRRSLAADPARCIACGCYSSAVLSDPDALCGVCRRRIERRERRLPATEAAVAPTPMQAVAAWLWDALVPVLIGGIALFCLAVVVFLMAVGLWWLIGVMPR